MACGVEHQLRQVTNTLVLSNEIVEVARNRKKKLTYTSPTSLDVQKCHCPCHYFKMEFVPFMSVPPYKKYSRSQHIV